MGKPEHHCDPKDPPYIKYTPPIVGRATTTTTLPPVSNYFVYPNSGLSCPDLSHQSELYAIFNCDKLSTPYETLLTNSSDECLSVNFSVVDDECSKGAIIQYKCCFSSSYDHVLVSGQSNSLCLAAGGEFRKVYGNVNNVYLGDLCNTTVPPTTTTTTTTPDPTTTTTTTTSTTTTTTTTTTIAPTTTTTTTTDSGTTTTTTGGGTTTTTTGGGTTTTTTGGGTTTTTTSGATTTTTADPSACTHGAGKPTLIKFGTYQIPDKLEVFYVSGGTDVLLYDTGQISTGNSGSPIAPYTSGYHYQYVDYCPEDLKYCVTASGGGTLWWIESEDVSGNTVYATAGGQLSSTECYGKTCTIPPSYVHSSSVSVVSPYSYTDYDARQSTAIFADRFTWKTGWETKLSGLTKTVLYTRESVFQDAGAFYYDRVKGYNQLLVCSGGQLWDFTELAVDTKTFDVARTDYTVDPPSSITTSYNWVQFEYCITTDFSDNTETDSCGGPGYLYNYAKPVFRDPSGLVN